MHYFDAEGTASWLPERRFLGSDSVGSGCGMFAGIAQRRCTLRFTLESLTFSLHARTSRRRSITNALSAATFGNERQATSVYQSRRRMVRSAFQTWARYASVHTTSK